MSFDIGTMAPPLASFLYIVSSTSSLHTNVMHDPKEFLQDHHHGNACHISSIASQPRSLANRALDLPENLLAFA